MLGLAKRDVRTQSRAADRQDGQPGAVAGGARHARLCRIRLGGPADRARSSPNWYSPPGKPNERLRINVFILSRALRSDSLSVTVDRQERSPTRQWADTPVAAETVTDLETAILLRARQIHAERYRSTYYK